MTKEALGWTREIRRKTSLTEETSCANPEAPRTEARPFQPFYPSQPVDSERPGTAAQGSEGGSPARQLHGNNIGPTSQLQSREGPLLQSMLEMRREFHQLISMLLPKPVVEGILSLGSKC